MQRTIISRDPRLSLFNRRAVLVCWLAAAALSLGGCDTNPDDAAAGGASPGESASLTPPPPAPQDELRETFATLPNLLAEAKTQAVFGQFHAIRDVQLTSVGDTLRVTATGNDPQMLLPAFVQGQKFVIEATLTSPAATTMQIFYLRKGQTSYNEGQSQSAALVPGRNVVYFRFDAPDIIDPLRVDIGATAGDYLIESMVARTIPR